MLTQKTEDKLEVIAYGSRSLTNTEQAYSHIEKELLAIAWALDHFRLYLLGNHFTLHTDHQPLTFIMKNPRTAPTARIERLILKTQRYAFTAVHQDGKANPADYLSRHPVENNHISKNKTEKYIAAILKRSTPKKMTVEEVKQHTAQDRILQKLKLAIETNRHDLWNDPSLKPYKTIRYEFTTCDDTVLRGHRIVIPADLQAKAIELAHRGHQGITKTKQLLRSKVWFPSIDKLTEETINRCIPCQATDAKKQRDPIEITKTPKQPFTNLDIDFAGPFPNKKYLVLIVDEYSRFPFVEMVNSTSFTCLKTVLEKIFAFVGFPKRIKTDNGPPFNGHDFEEFLSDLGIKHHRVTPEWPEANGMVERMVKTLKRSLICANIETNKFDSQLQAFLLNYRSTPHSTTSIPPFEMIYQWKVNDFLPTIKTRNKEGRNTEQERRLKGKVYADMRRHTRHNNLRIGDLVLCKQKKRNALTPQYDPKPFKIIKINGTAITAKREDKDITRNASFFKPIEGSDQKKFTKIAAERQSPKKIEQRIKPFSLNPVPETVLLTPIFEDELPKDQTDKQPIEEDQPKQIEIEQLVPIEPIAPFDDEEPPEEETSTEKSDSFVSVLYDTDSDYEPEPMSSDTTEGNYETTPKRQKRNVRPPDRFTPDFD